MLLGLAGLLPPPGEVACSVGVAVRGGGTLNTEPAARLPVSTGRQLAAASSSGLIKYCTARLLIVSPGCTLIELQLAGGGQLARFGVGLLAWVSVAPGVALGAGSPVSAVCAGLVTLAAGRVGMAASGLLFSPTESIRLPINSTVDNTPADMPARIARISLEKSFIVVYACCSCVEAVWFNGSSTL